VTLIFNVESKQYITCLYLRDKQIERYNLSPDNGGEAGDFKMFIHGYNNL
jgi:hypothetical protein